MHLSLLYPRYLGNLGLPHPFGGFTIQERLPQPHKHIHSPIWYHRVGREAKIPQFSATTHMHTLFSVMVLLLVSHKKRPSSLSPIHPFFGRYFLLCFVRGLPVQIGAMGGEGSHPSLPQGVTWAINKVRTVMGSGTGRN